MHVAAVEKHRERTRDGRAQTGGVEAQEVGIRGAVSGANATQATTIEQFAQLRRNVDMKVSCYQDP
jgi:hypothetical protein